MHNNWLALLLIIFIVIVINYHFNVLRQYEKYQEGNVLGPDVDKNQVVQGRLMVLNNLDNTVGKSALPDSNGNIVLVPEPNKAVFVGKEARINQIGESARNNQIGQSWLPHENGNAYIRPGRDGGAVLIGDAWTRHVAVAPQGNRIVQLGTDTWFPWQDGNVYIRPDRNSTSKVIRIGDANTRSIDLGTPNNQVRVRGRMMLGEFGDNTDPYYLEKVTNGENRSFLKVNLADDVDESLQIWGNHCASPGGCGGDGTVQHTFRADGTAIHNGNICIKNTCINENDLQKLQRVRA